MIGEPWFWRERSLAASATAATLSPLSALYDFAQVIRTRLTSPVVVNAPVICIGNATLGGVGKTPFAITLNRLLAQSGLEAHFLTRGYGGSVAGPVRVANQSARDVGDEALLLAAAGPTWVSRDRPAGANAAVAAGAQAVLMDDGYQNPTLAKDVNLLLINAVDSCGNGRIFPAGPMREPLSRAAGRANAIILVGEPGEAGVESYGKPAFCATAALTTPTPPQKILAFCGIGNPKRFFSMLKNEGFELAEKVAFPDHHAYTNAELARLRRRAKNLGAALMTTRKDAVRIIDDERDGIGVSDLTMEIDKPGELISLIHQAIARRK